MTEEKKNYTEDTGQTVSEEKQAAKNAGAAEPQAEAGTAQDSPGAAQETAGRGAGEAGAASSEEAADADEPEDAGEAPENEKESGGFLGRRSKKEIADLKAKNEALSDQIKRQMAEFDNYRKRTEKEKEQRFAMGEKNVAEKILPIVDNFERGLAALSAEEKEGAFAKGMDAVYRQMLGQLEALGVKPIECIGKEFNPDFHNAVMQVESEEYESGIVAQELLKGYMYHDTVLRHSMVGVVQ
ncbi:nucleotide exchange factor GrpE [Lachnoclostridium sp. Marseille-P6806]|uniref:nucleotide exchange factor GrpE n=1 Tax=Lachnoclostridium sp. Marseille-P6806 TaxID=2364793 RepID=UPI00102FE39F|nr:nucleotide exchange factor GrpE [Lachnoclostridium sp. Marseille-P6806]